MSKVKDTTAAIDGISECPGDPCETSMPSIIDGVSEIRGIFDIRSCTKSELMPPSYESKSKQQEWHEIKKWRGKKTDRKLEYYATYLCIDL